MTFPLATFQPKIALLSGVVGDASLEILLKPFVFQDEIVDTSVRLDRIQLSSIRLADLVGKTFDFPVNPAPGFIDGSIYLAHRHHPVDVTFLAFHRTRVGGATVVLKGVIDFEVEGDAEWGRLPLSFGVQIASLRVDE